MPPESPPPLTEELIEEPEGPLRYVWFDGILEGPHTPESDIADRIRRLNGAGFGKADLSVDGASFSMLLDDTPIPGNQISAAARRDFVLRLQEVLDLVPEGKQAESTLRCTEVFTKQTRETLFGVVGRRLHCASRLRANSAADDQRDPARRVLASTESFSRRTIALLTFLFVLAFGALAWQQGLFHRLFGTDPTQLTHELGPFAGLLEIDAASSWGSYELTVRRGARYPKTPEEVRVLQAGAATSADRAAVNAVADGSSVYLRLENEDGKVLEAEEVSLRALVTGDDPTVVKKLEGRIGARILRLALDEG